MKKHAAAAALITITVLFPASAGADIPFNNRDPEALCN